MSEPKENNPQAAAVILEHAGNIVSKVTEKICCDPTFIIETCDFGMSQRRRGTIVIEVNGYRLTAAVSITAQVMRTDQGAGNDAKESA